MPDYSSNFSFLGEEMMFNEYICKECLICSGVSRIDTCAVIMDARLCEPTHCIVDADVRPEWAKVNRNARSS